MNEHPAEHAPATRVVHAGNAPREQGGPFMGGPVFAAPFHHAGAVEDTPYSYTRYGNPTWAAYEAALGELEGGRAVVFPSGMAAVSAALFTLLKPGDVLVAPGDAYPGIRAVANEHLVPAGIEVRYASTDEADVRAQLDAATLVWIETPSNPKLDVLDIAALAQDVHAAGGLLVVDNTVATPLATQPLALGADVAMASATKSLSGHSDLLMGHLATRDDAVAQRLADYRTRVGAIPGPMEAWLAHRSLATLDVRLERQCASALAVARALEGDDRVTGVRYPGLESHPAHDVAARQMRGRFGCVVSFELPSAEAVDRFFAASTLVAQATSFGGAHTSAERRGRWGTDAVSDGFVRLSVGLEDAGDLLADVSRSLTAASS